MNTPNDLQRIMFATVPVNGYANGDPVTPIARGIVWLYRRLADSWQRVIHRAAGKGRRLTSAACTMDPDTAQHPRCHVIRLGTSGVLWSHRSDRR